MRSVLHQRHDPGPRRDEIHHDLVSPATSMSAHAGGGSRMSWIGSLHDDGDDQDLQHCRRAYRQRHSSRTQDRRGPVFSGA